VFVRFPIVVVALYGTVQCCVVPHSGDRGVEAAAGISVVCIQLDKVDSLLKHRLDLPGGPRR
jgi:hypothetical protein